MNRNSTFFARSQEVAQRFLQTAVVVDDRAFRSDSELTPTGPLNPPNTPSTIAPHPDTSLADTPQVTAGMLDPVGFDPHGFDAETVINGFARRGIVCSVLQRRSADTLMNPESSLGQLASVADILVLDWQVHSAQGESAEPTLELLEGVVTRDQAESRRQLRLIVIYTGERRLDKVAEDIRNRLREKLGEVQEDGEFGIIHGAVRIVVLGKAGVSRTASAMAQEASFDALAARTITEFTVMTAGLVSNVVLDALARLRCATHRILGRFPASLDAAFLVHRSLLSPPQEADEHLAPIIAAELLAVIEGAATPFPSANVAEWLGARETASPTHAALGFSSAEAERAWLRKLCEEGPESVSKGELPDALKWLREIGSNGAPLLDRLIELIRGVPVPEANEELAMLMAFKTRYSAQPPRLTLGTIVMQQKGNAKVFWLCLQPVCDSMHMKRAGVFPMLRLPQPSERFGVTVRVDGAFVRLRIDPRVSNLRTVEFKPDKTAQAVIATPDDNQQFWFESKDPEFRCRWIGELKFEQAQRAVQDLANQNSRVGLTESEWQRRWDR